MKLTFAETRIFNADDIRSINVNRECIEIETFGGENWGYEITLENLASIKQFITSIANSKKGKIK